MAKNYAWVSATALASGLVFAPQVLAQTASGAPAPVSAVQDNGGFGDIIVTAQKREQRLSDVGITVAAFSGDTLANQGVRSAEELMRIVPGLTVFSSAAATPVYSLRGVGFNEASLSAYPAVSVYVDEVPLPFPVMLAGVALDPARVEVLKGPQGTLFGQNSTAGAINYVAAAPTDSLSGGASLSYGRFNAVNVNGFVSGPLSPTLSARFSFDIDRADDWQKSYTRRGDTLGKVNRSAARLLLAWDATDRLRLKLNVNGSRDRSEPTAAQHVGTAPSVPAFALPAQLNYPFLPRDRARLADWSPEWGIRARDSQWQIALRGEYDLTDDVQLTSLTSYVSYKRNQRSDRDGTSLAIPNRAADGYIKSFFQELRLSNSGNSRLRWIVGANYGTDKTFDNTVLQISDSSSVRQFFAIGLPLNFTAYFTDQDIENTAVFGNAELKLTDTLSLKGGARYSRSNRTNRSCTYDTGDGIGAGVFTGIARRLNPNAPAIQPGGCTLIDAKTFIPGEFRGRLNEDNVSWTAGVDYKPSPDILLYANVSKGYKAGSFPALPASLSSQYDPVRQESLLDIEGGVKAQLFDRSVSFEASVFYYDYRDKQVRGKVTDAIFKQTEKLINIPKSSVRGAEASISARPTAGLTLSAAATYLDAKIDEYIGIDLNNNPNTDLSGSPMPYTPKWQLTGSFDYEWPLSSRLSAFVGGNVLYRSASYSGVGTEPIRGTGFNLDMKIDAYATLDLRAGIAAPDDSWRFSIWGKNVTDTYYWVSVDRLADTLARFPGMPATYGATLAVKF